MEHDDTSSTHQLADVENAIPDVDDFYAIPGPVHSRDGVHTMISSPYHEDMDKVVTGIRVQKDMTIEVVATER